MPKKEPTENVKCPQCGHESPPDSQVCANCSQPLSVQTSPTESYGVEELMAVPGIGDAKAHVLYKAGYRTVKDLQQADPNELAGVKGIGDKLAAKIIEGAQSVSKPRDEGLANWLSGEGDGLSSWLSGREGETKQTAEAVSPEHIHDDVLAKWLSGTEDGLDSWLTETTVRHAEQTALQ